MDEISTDEQTARYFAFGAEGEDLAARVYELVGVVRQFAEIEAVARELRLIKRAAAGLNRNVARRQLRRRQGARIE